MNKDEYLTTLNPVVVADRVPIIIMHIAHQSIVSSAAATSLKSVVTLCYCLFCRCTHVGKATILFPYNLGIVLDT